MPPKRRANGSGEGTSKKKKVDEKSINEKKSKLIQMVKEKPILYDLNDPNHKNSEMKKVIWDQIAAELDEDGEFLQIIYLVTVSSNHSA